MQVALLLFAACGFAPRTAVAYIAPPSVSLGEFLIQRSIQQQLYYSAQLRNEPMVNWLKNFRDHEHLDSFKRSEGNAGFPGTYSATFSQLKTTPYTEYLSALGTEPESTIEVKIVKPQKRLSARERANPYLNAQGPTVEIYNEPVIPANILTQLCVTAGALVETWGFHLGELTANDLARVANDCEATKSLPSEEMLRFNQLVRGGETVYSAYTQDEPMPLYDFDRRACDRLTTLRALTRLIAEVEALTPETAFGTSYLRREATLGADGFDNDAGVDELILKRRQVRRESFEAAFVEGDDRAKAAAARDAALFFLKDFCDTWVPKLVKGDERSDLQKNEYKPPPGMKEVRRADDGCDADKVFEALWEYQDEAAYEIVGGGELVFPFHLGLRLRELRSACAVEARAEVEGDIKAQIRSARLQYTSYTEEDEDMRSMAERFEAAADEEVYVWANDNMLGGM